MLDNIGMEVILLLVCFILLLDAWKMHKRMHLAEQSIICMLETINILAKNELNHGISINKSLKEENHKLEDELKHGTNK